jgi:hypothetical protein
MDRNRTTATALVLGLAVLGTAIDARGEPERADCQSLRGSIAETQIPSNDIRRLLSNVTGTLRGAGTVFITGLNPPASFDAFLTEKGDLLMAVGAPTRTPIPGQPGEFISHVELTITGGSGKYEGATGTMTFDGVSHNLAVPPTADLVYRGTVCGPHIKAHGDHED